MNIKRAKPSKLNQTVATRANLNISKTLEPVKLVDNLEIIEKLTNIAVNLHQLGEIESMKYLTDQTRDKRDFLYRKYDEFLGEVIARLDFEKEAKGDPNHEHKKTFDMISGYQGIKDELNQKLEEQEQQKRLKALERLDQIVGELTDKPIRAFNDQVKLAKGIIKNKQWNTSTPELREELTQILNTLNITSKE